MRVYRSRLMTTLCVLALATSLVRAEQHHRRMRGEAEGAWAGFDVVDTTTCPNGIVTHLLVHSNAGTVDSNGNHTATGLSTLVMSVWDYCLNAQVLSVSGSTTVQELQVEQGLGSATALVTFYVPNPDGRSDLDRNGPRSE
jgi:hypothetical protein